MTTEDPDRPAPAPEKPKEISWGTVDRLDWQSWLLAVSLIVVLGAGLLSFMFPTTFWSRENMMLRAPDRAFYGFCIMLGLALMHLLQKQSALRKIRRRLAEERTRREEELVHNAFSDSLTNLPNRALLVDRLRHCLSRTKRHKDYLFAVILLDLDRFKLVNDSMGHRTGDRVLIEVARRLQRCFRAEDTVARLGGDEFCVLLDGVKQLGDVSRAVERIGKEFASPINLEGREIFTSPSMGSALSWTGYEQAEDLLRDADTAMYRAKALGTGQHAVFDASMHEQAVKLLSLETDLRRALERDELVCTRPE